MSLQRCLQEELYIQWETFTLNIMSLNMLSKVVILLLSRHIGQETWTPNLVHQVWNIYHYKLFSIIIFPPFYLWHIDFYTLDLRWAWWLSCITCNACAPNCDYASHASHACHEPSYHRMHESLTETRNTGTEHGARATNLEPKVTRIGNLEVWATWENEDNDKEDMMEWNENNILIYQ